MTPLAQEHAGAAEVFLRALTLRAGGNTSVVVIGVAMLGLAGGVVGTFTLLRKRAMLSDAVSHAGLPGVCAGFLIASALGVEGRSLPLLLLGAAVFGALAVASVHLLAAVPRWKEDAAIAAALSVFFALGVVLLSRIQTMKAGNQAGLQAFIFGQAAAISRQDALLLGIAALGVSLVALLAFKELRLLCFDRAFGASIGAKPGWIDALLTGMTLAVAVLGMQAVGIVLVVALLIIPAAAARFWTERLWRMTALAGAFGAIGAGVGAAASASIPRLPTGPAIVCACAALFLLSMTFAPTRGLAARAIRRAAVNRIVARQHLHRAMFEVEERDASAGVSAERLGALRAWKPAHTLRLLRAAEREGDATRHGDRWRLTERGRERAARLVRSHRLWEMYLITHADIAPSHVDRTADEVEHVLGKELVARLEAELGARGLAPGSPGAPAPPSPHSTGPTGSAP